MSIDLLYFVSAWAIVGMILTPISFSKKGRNPVLGFGLGILLGGAGGALLLLPLWLFVPEVKKRCPRCAELVKRKAVVCKHCQHQFTEQDQATWLGDTLQRRPTVMQGATVVLVMGAAHAVSWGIAYWPGGVLTVSESSLTVSYSQTLVAMLVWYLPLWVGVAYVMWQAITVSLKTMGLLVVGALLLGTHLGMITSYVLEAYVENQSGSPSIEHFAAYSDSGAALTIGILSLIVAPLLTGLILLTVPVGRLHPRMAYGRLALTIGVWVVGLFIMQYLVTKSVPRDYWEPYFERYDSVHPSFLANLQESQFTALYFLQTFIGAITGAIGGYLLLWACWLPSGASETPHQWAIPAPPQH